MKVVASIIAVVLSFIMVGTVAAQAFVETDTFTENSGDVAIESHTSDTGGTWQIITTPGGQDASWVVYDPCDCVQFRGSSGIGQGFARYSAPIDDGTISLEPDLNNTTDNIAGVMFRYTSTTNHWRAVVIQDGNHIDFALQKVEAGIVTSPVFLDNPGGSLSPITVILEGSNIVVKTGVGLTERANITDTFNDTSNVVGFYMQKAGVFGQPQLNASIDNWETSYQLVTIPDECEADKILCHIQNWRDLFGDFVLWIFIMFAGFLILQGFNVPIPVSGAFGLVLVILLVEAEMLEEWVFLSLIVSFAMMFALRFAIGGSEDI